VDKTSYKKYLLSAAICLLIFPLAGLISDPSYFRFAVSRVFPGVVERSKIEAAVTSFNNCFMDVYASEGSKRAGDLVPATMGMRHRLFKDAGFVGMGGRVLIYDLASLKIETVAMTGPLSATAIAREEWNYQYKNDRTWQSVAGLHGNEFHFRYLLVKQGGKWLVQKYEPVREVAKGA
jgi:hypothetical protein